MRSILKKLNAFFYICYYEENYHYIIDFIVHEYFHGAVSDEKSYSVKGRDNHTDCKKISYNK